MSAGHHVYDSEMSVRVISTMPAGFQYVAVASFEMAVKAPPIPEPRADTPIFRNWREYVPTFAKGSVANDCDGSAATTSAAAIPCMNLDLTVSNLLKDTGAPARTQTRGPTATNGGFPKSSGRTPG